jgi:hypothetical protein
VGQPLSRASVSKGAPDLTARSLAVAVSLVALATTACSRTGEIDSSGGITAVRTVCPSVAVPAQTGDVTLFTSPTDRSADAIDVNAIITNVRSTCTDTVDPIVTQITFDVLARRTDTATAREVVLPYFTTVLQGGTVVVAKRVGRVALRFEAGQARARASATGTTYLTRAAATLPDDIREQITRKRKAGQEDAAIDPLADPAVRSAVAKVTFESLVGFQLTDEQLKYNVTR